MAVKSADRKPEKYVGPDGKPRIRMVPVDREVVKTEGKLTFSDLKRGQNKAADKMENTVDEISLKDLSNSIAKSTGNKNLTKALKTDKLKKDLATMKMKLATEAYEKEPPSPDEKSMAMRQAKFIQYVGEELMEYMEQEKDFPEWMQNKLSELHQSAKDMHGVLAGEYEDDDDEDDVKESTQIDEISQDMKQRYMNRASQAATAATVASKYAKGFDKEKFDRIAKNRKAGVKKVVGEYGGPPISRAKYLKQKPMKERELTPGEMKKREKYAKDLPDAEFKKRYGDRWKSVKIATATKMAKGEK